MLTALRTLPALALTTALALGHPATADAEPNADTVVATVNGTDITLGHMILVRAGLPQQYAQLPAEVLFEGILDQLIQQTVLAQSLEGEPDTKTRLAIENENRAIIASGILEGIVADAVTPGALQEAYDAKYADADPGTEFSAAHILVETEEEAKELVAELEGGADFAALAREKSTGPSGPNGGDLGWFGLGMMVQPFEDAVVAMKAGDISAPVQTQFGWHVIKLNETRRANLPTLDEVRDELDNELRRAAVDAHVASLTSAAEIDRTGEAGIDPAVLEDLELLEN